MSSNVRNAIAFIIVVLFLLFLARSCHQGSNPVSDVLESTENAIEKTTATVKDAGNAVVEKTENALEAGSDAVKSAGNTVVEAGDSVTTAVSDGANSLLKKLGEFFSVTLPNGVDLSIPEFGVENKLIKFINSDKPADKETWFEFDRIGFATGSSSLSNDSKEQIGNIAAILTGYPDVSLKIGGYTDNTGTEAVNKRISQERADAVKNALVAEDIASSRLATEGYGPAHPVASNDTEEGRAKNRRIALRVTAK